MMKENLTVTPKIKVAFELIESGLQMYFDRAYFAALHLAGGADEILGGYVTRIGEDNAYTSLKRAAVDIGEALYGEGATTPEQIHKLMVYARNRTKHLDADGDDEVLFDSKLEAQKLLSQALVNYHNLANYLPLADTALMRKFREERRTARCADTE